MCLRINITSEWKFQQSRAFLLAGDSVRALAVRPSTLVFPPPAPGCVLL